MNKLFLITYPDYYHSEIDGILLVNITTDEQLELQQWLSKNDIEIIVYLYNNDNQIEWLLNVINQSKNVYINIDNSSDISYHYISYVVSKPNVSYKSSNIDYSILNKGKVRNINEFMEKYQF